MTKLNEKRIPLSCRTLSEVLRPLGDNRTYKTDYEIKAAKSDYQLEHGCAKMNTEYEAENDHVVLVLSQQEAL